MKKLKDFLEKWQWSSLEDADKTLTESEKKIWELMKKNQDLEKQLADVKNSCDYYMKRSNNLVVKLAEKEKENLALAHIITGWDDYNQEKIEFAIEQLEKMKEWVSDMFNGWKTNQQVNQLTIDGICLALENIGYKIDNQIKELKGEENV